MLDNATASGKIGRRIPWFQGWTVLFAAMAIQGFALGIYTFSFTFWVTPWTTEFNASRGEVMVALMAGNFWMSILSPIAGRAMDRLSLGKIVAVGVVIFAAGLFLVSRAEAIWQIIAVYALLLSIGGLLTGPIPGQCLAVRWFTTRRGLALGLVSVGSSIGGFLLPPLATWLGSDYGWRMAHVILAAAALVIFLPIALLLIRTPAAETEAAATGSADTTEGGKQAPRGNWTVGKLLTSAAYWKITAGLLPLVLGIILLTANLGPFTHDLGIAAQSASFLMSAFALCMILGKLGVGTLTDYLDYRYIYALIIAAIIVAYLIMLFHAGYPGMLMASMLLGLSAGSFSSLTAVIVSKQFGIAVFGTAIGLVFMTYSLLAVVVPLSGWARDYFGTYDPVWWSAVVVTLVVTPIMFSLRPPAPVARD